MSKKFWNDDFDGEIDIIIGTKVISILTALFLIGSVIYLLIYFIKD